MIDAHGEPQAVDAQDQSMQAQAGEARGSKCRPRREAGLLRY